MIASMSRTQSVAALGLASSAVLILLLVPPLPQDPDYHGFADRRSLLGIAHFWNVLTNAPFALVGVLGLAASHRLQPGVQPLHYRMLCVAVFLVSLGSAYYHVIPDTQTLVWDRLPITMAFMALFTIVLGDRVDPTLARRAFWPLIAAGLASVVYWYATELQGRGDLRPYALVQFVPVLLIPVLLLTHPGRGMRASWMWLSLLGYVLAKLAEHYDDAIMHLLMGFSGHSVKHLLAAAAVWCAMLAMLRPAGSDRIAAAAMQPLRIP
jgi:hypothetical protein